MNMFFVLICFIFSFLSAHALQQQQQQQQQHIQQIQQQANVLFLPLDERFTTRDAFLNLAKLTPFSISTPAPQYISYWRQPANLDYIDSWIDDNLHNTTAIIFSSELYLYGGLITSRSSNDSTDAILARLAQLVSYKTKYPNIKMYVSSVVMRIPAYNEDFEEPIYWGTYGYDLYLYSFYLDRYNVLKNESDLVEAKEIAAEIPADILTEFLWRRERNHNVTMAMVEYQRQNIFEQLFITLDDNAPYGLNIAESLQLKQLVSTLGLGSSVKIYPGADEVGLTMLAKMSTQFVPNYNPAVPLQVFVVYRNQTTQDYVPNYEGQPMNLTVLEQIEAAGGVIANVSQKDADVVLLVNNFNDTVQIEAPNQPPVSTRSPAEFATFIPSLQTAHELQQIVGFADNRFSNGGDLFLVDWIYNISNPYNELVSINRLCYAGWNTDGNKLGTVISNIIILKLFGQYQQNPLFQAYRFVEDAYYQSIDRQILASYADQTGTDSELNLSGDLPFYERFSLKLLNASMTSIASWYNLPYHLISVYYPWNRTFEIGLLIQ